MDQGHLRRALELAERGRGRVSPNPLVGAVVVRDGEVIGEGFHAELGGLHAERAALADCRERGEDPAGATMYVTLEPCAHQGRQPPCVEAMLEAGIARVVIASEDPSEKAAGRGPGILRDGGVEVVFAAGAEAAAARLLNQPFRKHARTGLPLVTLKLAMSLDGQTDDRARRLALDLRRAQPRPGPPLARRIRRDRRRHRHRPRRRPPAHRPPRSPTPASRSASSSTPRPASRSTPSSSRPSTSPRSSSSPPPTPTRPASAPSATPAPRSSSPAAHLADRITSALADLGRRDITSLFLEGGRTLASAFVAAGQIDESRTFVAPMLLGSPSGGRAPRAGPGAGPARLTALASHAEPVGEDTLITARFKEW